MNQPWAGVIHHFRNTRWNIHDARDARTQLANIILFTFARLHTNIFGKFEIFILALGQIFWAGLYLSLPKIMTATFLKNVRTKREKVMTSQSPWTVFFMHCLSQNFARVCLAPSGQWVRDLGLVRSTSSSGYLRRRDEMLHHLRQTAIRGNCSFLVPLSRPSIIFMIHA